MARKSINKIQLIDDASQSSTLFAIVSSEPGYKLSVLINQSLGNSLQSTEPVVITFGDKTTTYTRFTDNSRFPLSSLSLIHNRSEQQTLLRKFPNIDYILVRSVEGATKEEEERYSSLLRRIEHITAIFIIDRERVEPTVIEAIMPAY